MRQLVIQIGGYERFVVYAQYALNHQLQTPRFGSIEFHTFGNRKPRYFFKVGRTFGCQINQAFVLRVGEAEAVFALNHLDTVENAAADIARTFPRITAFTSNQDSLLTGLQAVLQVFPTFLAQQAFADGRLADYGCVQIDKGIVACTLFGVFGNTCFAAFFKQLVDFVNSNVQMTDGFLFQQRIPRLDVLFVRIDSAARSGLSRRGSSLLRIHSIGGGRLNGFVSAQTIFAGNNFERTLDAVVNHHQRNGRAADDVPGCNTRSRRIFNKIQTDILIDEFIHTRLRDTNKHNRLMVIDQLRTGDRSIVGQSHHRINRFARIAARIDHVRRDIHQTQLLVALINTGNHRLAFRLAITVCTRKNFRRLDF